MKRVMPNADVLRLHYAAGLTNAEIAPLYGVHKGTVHKWCRALKVKNPRRPGVNKYPFWLRGIDNFGADGRRKGWEKAMRLAGFDPETRQRIA
jgi:hypothetical protein